MKTLLAILVLLCAATATPHAAPIAFPEISLLVRMGDPESYIAQQVSERRLLRALTPDQETRLKREGAPETLLQKLRNPATILPEPEASAFETARAAQMKVLEHRLALQTAEETQKDASRIAVAAALSRQQTETAAAERVDTRASASATALSSSDYSSFPYGSYIYGGYAYPSYVHTPGPGHVRPAGPAAFSLQWQNGTATTYTSPGLNYHPLGTNGANTTHSGARPAFRASPAPAPRFGR